MNKYDILKKSREENKNGDERERLIRKGIATPTLIAMGVIGVILMLLEKVYLETELLSNSLVVLFVVATAVQQWYMLLVVKQKFYIFSGILLTINSIIVIRDLIDTFVSMM